MTLLELKKLDNKSIIIVHYENSIDWVNKLNTLSENQWRTPIGKDKWTIAEVIGHLIPWDKFVINERIPYILENTILPPSLNTSEFNLKASIIAQRRSKEETIEEFILIRHQLIDTINKIDNRLWYEIFSIGTSSMSLFNYFLGLIEHDNHHFQQICKVLNITF
jgi:hypothetical protein